MRNRAYEVVDVFTNTRFGGNQLAVVLDAEGLDTATMQQIAIEFGFSETTFVLPPANPAHTAHVRIFTTTTEVPFAGHPNVGTAFVLASHGQVFGKPVGDQMIFEEQAGLVHVEIERHQGQVIATTISAPRQLEVGRQISVDLVAACVSLNNADIAIDQHPPIIASVGLPFVITQLKSRAALAEAQPNLQKFEEAHQQIQREKGEFEFALFLYHPTPGTPNHFSARMFVGLDEDPATGSASGALGAYWASLQPEADAELRLQIEQGVDMGRPSQIYLQISKVQGVVQKVLISGSSVLVMRGELVL